MAQTVEDHFDYMVPNAASKAKQFLGVIQQRSRENHIGFELHPAQTSRGSNPRIVMRGEVKLGGLLAKRPYIFEVFADPVGSMLQVGWQLRTSNTESGFYAYTGLGKDMAFLQNRAASRPETIRQLSGLSQAFHHLIFVPTLEQLVAAVGEEPPESGFLGA